MRIVGEWLRRFQYLIHRRRFEEELAREMQIHRELMREPKRFGNVLLLRERSRDVWGWTWVDDLSKDVVYGLRQLRRTPGFTALAVLTLAIAIGGLTAFSGLMKAALYANLPVRNPDELAQVVSSFRSASGLARRPSAAFSYPIYRYLQSHTSNFSDAVCWTNASYLNLRTRENLLQVSAQFVSGNFFATTGLETALGRPISTEDDAASAAPIAILSYGAWQRLFGGDERIVGQRVTLNGTAFIVAGVLANKEIPRTPQERWEADLILPVSIYTPALVKAADSTSSEASCRIIGRIAPGISRSRARQETEELIRQAFELNPVIRQGRSVFTSRDVFVGLRGLRTIDQLDGSFAGAPLLILLLVASLLAIVCSNIAGMTLARGAVRRAEVATRLALGAGRRRIVRQLLTESLLLSAIGGATGVGLCFVARNFIPWAFAIDLPVLLITAALCCLTGLVFGLFPALTSTRLDLTSVMKRSTSGSLGRTFRSGNILIGVQVTLSLLLVVAAGLQVRSLMRMMVPTNFEPQRVLTIRAHPGSAGYSAERIHLYFEQAVQRLEGLPGITAATASTGDGGFTLLSTGSATDVRVIADYVTPGFFETMKIPVVLGRDMSWTDRKGAPLTVIVNETFARTLFPQSVPLGNRVRLREGFAEIVGVVEDSNNSVGDAFAFGQAAQPSIYVPFQQQPVGSGTMLLSARFSTDSPAFITAARRVVQDIDPDVVVDQAETQASQSNIHVRERRLLVGTLSVAGLIALLEVSFGVYGILSFFVGTRVREIGLRIALGARRSDVIRMVLRQSAIPVGIGILAGLAAAPALIRVLENGDFLVGTIRIGDALAILASALLLLGVALSAAVAPARRAARAHPMQALRHE